MRELANYEMYSLIQRQWHQLVPEGSATNFPIAMQEAGLVLFFGLDLITLTRMGLKQTWFSRLFFYGFYECVYLKPVKVKKNKTAESEKPSSPEEIAERELEFGRYLQQVVQALEGDPELGKRLQNVSEEELKSGKFSNYLHSAHGDTRSKLDEFKRMEVERVKKLIHHQQRNKEGSQHLDIHSPTFEVDDMQKLIMAAKSHYDEIEKLQEEEFKQYEMEKKLKHDVELKHMEEKERKRVEEEDQKQKKLIEEEVKHMKHPGSKHQLEDAYKALNFDPRDMDPNNLFEFLDLNSDKILESDELRVLFLPEIHELKHMNQTEKDHELDRYERHFYKTIRF
ncbi:Nucleobindin-2 [Nymphon striatum]|nr:Nucleobindin-2 [Nymphon striatum]